MAHDADSAAQRSAEAAIRDALNLRQGWNLQPTELEVAPGVTVSIDGIDRRAGIAVEIIARIGERSASRDKKVVADATKLFLAKRALSPSFRLLLVGCDAEFLSYYDTTSSKWQAHALRELGIELTLVDLPPAERQLLVDAQERQGRGNTKAQRVEVKEPPRARPAHSN